MTIPISPKIALGPILYYWPRETVFKFYDSIDLEAIDIIYLGETVCSKRRTLSFLDWVTLGKYFSDQGKEIILSTLTLIESQSELATLNRICKTEEWLVEANDMAAVQILTEANRSFVAGPHLNLYNPQAIRYLLQRGMRHWVVPVETSKQALISILTELAAGHIQKSLRVEYLVYGKLPLAHSARCFAARAQQRTKDTCGFCCVDYPDGLPVTSQEGASFATINGVQVQSGLICNLLPNAGEMLQMGVDVFRISPQLNQMEALLNHCRSLRDAQKTPTNSHLFSKTTDCNGYWYGKAGNTKNPYGA